MGPRNRRLRREVLALVGLLVLLDVLFVGGYYLGDLGRRSAAVRLGYTAVWTLATLVVVLRGLARVRAERLRRRRE